MKGINYRLLITCLWIRNNIIIFKDMGKLDQWQTTHKARKFSLEQASWIVSFCFINSEAGRNIAVFIPWLIVLHNFHYNDVIMSAMASQITSLTIVYLSVNSGVDQRKHQSSASLAFVRGIPRWPVNSPHIGPLTRKMFPFDDVTNHERSFMSCLYRSLSPVSLHILIMVIKAYRNL